MIAGLETETGLLWHLSNWLELEGVAWVKTMWIINCRCYYASLPPYDRGDDDDSYYQVACTYYYFAAESSPSSGYRHYTAN